MHSVRVRSSDKDAIFTIGNLFCTSPGVVLRKKSAEGIPSISASQSSDSSLVPGGTWTTNYHAYPISTHARPIQEPFRCEPL